MPLAKLICYCDSCKGRVAVPKGEALAHAETRATGVYTYEFLSAMLETVQDRNYISTTTVLSGKCLRSEWLKRHIDYTDDPKKLYASFRGTMFHGRLELNAHPDSIAEPRFHVYLDGLGWLSGSPDLLDVNKGMLYDYKSTREVPVFDYPWPDHREQMQVNRWLVDHADYATMPDGSAYPFTDRGAMEVHGELVHEDILAGHRARFRPVDWQGLVVVYMDNDRVKPILVSKSIDIPQKGNPGKTKKARVAYIMDDAEVEELVRTNYEAALALDGEEVPPIPDNYAYWRHPLCGYCPVKDACVDEYIEEQVDIRTRSN